MTSALQAFGITHPGQRRDDNEDAFALSPTLRLFSVADGMGGRADGARAARLAVDELEAFIEYRRLAPRAAWPFPVDESVDLGANLLRVGFMVANAKVRQQGRSAAVGPLGGACAGAQTAVAATTAMGATCAALLLGKSQLVAAHAGDVRIYRLRGTSLRRLTRDHSVYEDMQAARPDVRPAESHRAVVTRGIGIRDQVEPTVYVNAFAADDVYLLCSDGLWGVVNDAEITQILTATGDLESVCQLLVDAANDAGGPDNITALLVRAG